MSTYARIQNGIVAEIFLVPAGFTLAECVVAALMPSFVDIDGIAPAPQPGWTFTAPATFAAPVPVPPTPTQQAAILLSAGCQIVSTGTPAISGTYALDANSLFNLTALSAGIAAGKPLPGGGITFNYPDISAAQHAFTGANFLDMAVAVEGYVYAINQTLVALADGQTASFPTLPITIP
jgi:hypothetical protein